MPDTARRKQLLETPSMVINPYRFGGGGTPISLVSATGQSGTSTSVTTGNISTTGASGIVLACYTYNNDPVVGNLSDNQGNGYTRVTVYNHSGARIAFFYCQAPNVSATHNFTYNAGGSAVYPSLVVAALANMATSSSLDSETGSNTDYSPGPLTPGTANCVVMACCAHVSGSAVSVNDGFTQAYDLAYPGSGRGAGMCLAYKIQTAAAVADPTFSTSWANAVSAIAAFKRA